MKRLKPAEEQQLLLFPEERVEARIELIHFDGRRETVPVSAVDRKDRTIWSARFVTEEETNHV